MEALFEINNETKQNYVRDKKQKQLDFAAIVNGLYQNSPSVMLESNGKTTSLYAYYFSRISADKNDYKRQTFKRLLIHLYNQQCFGIIQEKSDIDILFKMSLFGDRFVRTIEGWKRKDFYGKHQFNSLFQYCFELYPTATFLRETFYKRNHRHINWYLDIALGKSVFELKSFPSMFTKKMAHEFTNIQEEDCTVERAFSIAFIKSCKPSKLVETLMINSTLIWENLMYDEFWKEAVFFFCKYEFLEHYEFYNVLDYLKYIRDEDVHFSLKGRTFNSVKRLSDEWHGRVHSEKQKRRKLAWKPQEIEAFEYVEVEDNKEKAYKIKELCSSTELFVEGKEMKHCVAGYDAQCLRGQTAIFTMYRFRDEDTIVEKLVTIELDLYEKQIVQARGKYNNKPTEKCIAIIEKWATEIKYTIYEYAF